jgi:flagella basal body P-ring formation protein FlgA
MMKSFFILILAFHTLLLQAEVVSGCHPIAGDRITGQDLAAVVPELQLLPKDFLVGYSPFPGAVRVFRAAQLQQIATSHHLPAGRIYSPVCFAWHLRIPSKQELTDAVKTTLDSYKADVTITDESHVPVPEGKLTFPLRGLTADTIKPAIWNGYVTYAQGRRFNTWVQVQITVHEQRLISARPIRAGEVIAAADIKKVEYAGSMSRTPMLTDEKAVIGQCARFPIADGEAFTPSMLFPPLDVAREDMVTVLISCGAAHIQTQGIAAESGYVGSVIHVRNPKTGRVFRARIDERGVVTVVAGGAIGLVAEDGKS